MPLTMAKAGEKLNIKRITGNEETKRHLENLGFIVGAEITIISNLSGNLILSVKGARLALGNEMAKLIIV